MDAAALAAITEAMQPWRQGDAVVGNYTFTHIADLARPLSSAAEHAAVDATAEGDPLSVEPIDTIERGFVILTQTCDIIRPAQSRKYVEVAPLVEVNAATLNEIRKRKRPAFVYVPNLANQSLVGDLDRVMTVEKSVVAGWQRVAGCNSSAEQAEFARALARKRARYAFPDEFGDSFRAFRDHVRQQRNQGSLEGQHFDSLSEIRVTAEPDWDTQGASLTFYFIIDDGELQNEAFDWVQRTETWGNMLVPDGWVLGGTIAVELSTLNAKTYLESAPIDTDDFSPDV